MTCFYWEWWQDYNFLLKKNKTLGTTAIEDKSNVADKEARPYWEMFDESKLNNAKPERGTKEDYY